MLLSTEYIIKYLMSKYMTYKIEIECVNLGIATFSRSWPEMN